MQAIYATDISYGLSKKGGIPWKSKKDMSFFFNKTKHNVVIMGRKTFFSLPEEFRPLKNRLNIILTSKPEDFSNKDNKYKDAVFTNNNNIHDSILNCREEYQKTFPYLKNDFNIFIIGGKNVYEQFIPLCEKVWVTCIKKDYSCDLFLNYDFSKQFTKTIIAEDDELTIFEYCKYE